MLRRFREVMARCGYEASNYSLYSYRRGLLTSALLAGIPKTQLGLIGRWAEGSTAWRHYDGMHGDARIPVINAIANVFEDAAGSRSQGS